MGDGSCEREADVMRMVRSHSDDEALRAHAAECAACRETLAVSVWMRQMADAPLDAAPLPDPTYLWYKAQLLRQWDAERQALAPIEFWKRVQVMVSLAGAAAVLVWLWDTLPRMAVPPSDGNVVVWASLAGTVTPVLILSAVLLAATAIVVVHDWVARE